MTDFMTRARHIHQQRLILSEPETGWSREDYDRELAAYAVERGRAPQTATMHTETAVALGIPLSTVKTRLYRTTSQMRAALDADARLPLAHREAM